jgi:hypothetical protein
MSHLPGEESDDETVELDTWSEEEDGVEDPFENEDEEPTDGPIDDSDEATFSDGFAMKKKQLPQPESSSFAPDLPKVSVSSLKVKRLLK